MELNRFQRLAYRLLGTRVQRSAQTNVHLRLSLQKARILIRPEVYLANAYLNMLLAFVATLALVLVMFVLTATGVIDLPTAGLMLLVPLPFVLALTLYLLSFLIPDLRASTRARDIDAKLPYALNFIATMAGAGVAPQRIFAKLAEQEIYGEVSREAALINRDLTMLGRDLVGALTAAIDRSPSVRFQDFLQGAITALTSGEDLKVYFRTKSEQYVYENRQDQKRFLENLGLIAESYVTVVVAAPVLMIVLLSVFMMFGGSGRNMLEIGYVLILFLLPAAQAMFGATISRSTPKV